MNAVVSTVKSSYVASTKFKNRQTQNNVVSFRLRPHKYFLYFDINNYFRLLCGD